MIDLNEIAKLLDAFADAERSATIHGGNDRAQRASDARASLLQAVERVLREPQDAESADFEALLALHAEHYAAGRQAEGEDAGNEILGCFRSFRREIALLTHKVITCGVAASHPDAGLSRRGAYAGKWDSPQAEEVRKLRARAEAAERSLSEMRSALTDLLALVPEPYPGGRGRGCVHGYDPDDIEDGCPFGAECDDFKAPKVIERARALASSPPAATPDDGVADDGTIIHALAYLLRATYDVEGMSDEQRDVWRTLVGRARGEYDATTAERDRYSRTLDALVSDAPDSKFTAEIIEWRRRVRETVQRNCLGPPAAMRTPET